MYVLVIYNLKYSVDIYMFILFFIFLKQDSIWCFVVETRGEEKMKQKLGLQETRTWDIWLAPSSLNHSGTTEHLTIHKMVILHPMFIHSSYTCPVCWPTTE